MPRIEEQYRNTVLAPIRICAQYKPKLGHGSKDGGYALNDFMRIYGEDPFYSWMGLDNPLLYAAHKAAGGMTSIYRQIGIGCENLFRDILKNSLNLTDSDVEWSYNIPKASGEGTRNLSLDGRIPTTKLTNGNKERFQEWLIKIGKETDVAPSVVKSLQGVVFEVRQGYKSKDSKRQNADIANAATAYAKGYLPCVAVLSKQIDNDIVARYKAEHWGILIGSTGDADSTHSIYAFMREVVGYDLEAFFKRNKTVFRAEIDKVLKNILSPE